VHRSISTHDRNPYKHFTSFLPLPACFLIHIGYHLYRFEPEDTGE
jgi:hypothetical protein